MVIYQDDTQKGPAGFKDKNNVVWSRQLKSIINNFHMGTVKGTNCVSSGK